MYVLSKLVSRTKFHKQNQWDVITSRAQMQLMTRSSLVHSANVFSHHLSTSCHMVTAFVLLGPPPNSAIHFHSFRSISAEKKDRVGETQRVWPVAFFPGFTIKLLLEFKRPCPSFGRLLPAKPPLLQQLSLFAVRYGAMLMLLLLFAHDAQLLLLIPQNFFPLD